jgi:hypothetical protein
MADGPDIGFIDSSNATCYRAAPSTNRCYIGWEPLYVAADTSQYIISMTVSIDNRVRGYFSGFFQNYMYIPFEQLAPGYLVDCGLPGSGGNPSMGKTYPYTIRARETGGLSSANYGSVTCPADIVAATDVILSGPATGYVGVPVQFTASVTPPNASPPITYTWTATSQTTGNTSGGNSSPRNYTWGATGNKQVKVDVTNAAGVTVSATKNINILRVLYLPLVRR